MASPRLVCFGGAHIDLIARSHQPVLPGTSNPGTVERRFGGVALNVAMAAVRAGVPSASVGWVGNDYDGASLREHLAVAGVGDWLISLADATTGHYVAIEEPDGEMRMAVADLDIRTDSDLAALSDRLTRASSADWWFADANIDAQGLERLTVWPGRPPLAVDAVSEPKAERLHALLDRIDLLFCNRGEAGVLSGAAEGDTIDLGQLGPSSVVMTDGASPVRLYDGTGEHQVDVAPMRGSVLSATGRGDRLAGTTLARIILGDTLTDAVGRGVAASGNTGPAPSEQA